jgi:hypothetical protein
MKPRRGATPIPKARPSFVRSAFFFLLPTPLLVLLLTLLIAAGCGVPGDPVPPSPPIPNPVTDLKAHQIGDGVLLTFTLPSKSTLGERLTQTPTMEVFRGSLKPDGEPDARSFRLVDTVPGSLLSTYAQGDQVSFPERFSAEETSEHPGETAIYRVRTRVSERKVSADSNDATLSLYPVPERIGALETHLTENNIQLTWSPVTRTSSGTPLPTPPEYHVYRGELDPASATAAAKNLHNAVWKLPLLEIATTDKPEYQDSGFDYGRTYAYVVRSVVLVNGAPLESGDSQPAILTPKDVFPPAAPQDVVAAILPGASPGTSVVDLSWAINTETDLEGYRVYRSERENEQGQLLTPELLPSSAYRDSNALEGRRYWYTVTAVDHAGNESRPSASVLVEIP